MAWRVTDRTVSELSSPIELEDEILAPPLSKCSVISLIGGARCIGRHSNDDVAVAVTGWKTQLPGRAAVDICPDRSQLVVSQAMTRATRLRPRARAARPR